MSKYRKLPGIEAVVDLILDPAVPREHRRALLRCRSKKPPRSIEQILEVILDERVPVRHRVAMKPLLLLDRSDKEMDYDVSLIGELLARGVLRLGDISL